MMPYGPREATNGVFVEASTHNKNQVLSLGKKVIEDVEQAAEFD